MHGVLSINTLSPINSLAGFNICRLLISFGAKNCNWIMGSKPHFTLNGECSLQLGWLLLLNAHVEPKEGAVIIWLAIARFPSHSRIVSDQTPIRPRVGWRLQCNTKTTQIVKMLTGISEWRKTSVTNLADGWWVHLPRILQVSDSNVGRDTGYND